MLDFDTVKQAIIKTKEKFPDLNFNCVMDTDGDKAYKYSVEIICWVHDEISLVVKYSIMNRDWNDKCSVLETAPILNVEELFLPSMTTFDNLKSEIEASYIKLIHCRDYFDVTHLPKLRKLVEK